MQFIYCNVEILILLYSARSPVLVLTIYEIELTLIPVIEPYVEGSN